MFPADLEAILFDAGGTLVRIDTAFVARAAASAGHPVRDSALIRGEASARLAIDEAARAGGRVQGSDAGRIPGYFANLLRAAGLPEEFIGIVGRAMEVEHAASNLWRVPMEGSRETLAALRRRGLRTAVVSNSDGRIRARLESLGLAEALELVVDSHEEGVEKPDPGIFERALERLHVTPERAVYIGDIYSIDAVGARAAGLRPILIDPTGSYSEADCATIAALPEILEVLVRDRGSEESGPPRRGKERSGKGGRRR